MPVCLWIPDSCITCKQTTDIASLMNLILRFIQPARSMIHYYKKLTEILIFCRIHNFVKQSAKCSVNHITLLREYLSIQKHLYNGSILAYNLNFMLTYRKICECIVSS